MAPKTKINLKERFEDGELDLSLSELQEVPVREIAAMKKATSLDLSNNQLVTLGKNFVTLTHIIKLDLGKNLLTELPENFGEMKQLKHLDLYHNQLTHLPLSFYQLKNLRWLDLKDNPLVPAVAKIAGPCLDQQQCTQCAKSVVQFFTTMNEQIQEEKQRREQQKQLELETELAEQRKQQKKKEKNKALKAKKNKNKAERKLEAQQQSQFIDYVKEPAVLNGHTKTPQKTQKMKKNLLGRILAYCLFFMLALFVFTTFKTNYALEVKRETIQLWHKFVNLLPEDCKPCTEIVANSVAKLHQITGNISENCVNFFVELQKNEHVHKIVVTLKSLFNTLLTESRKIFHVLSDQAIVFRNEIKRIFIENF